MHEENGEQSALILLLLNLVMLTEQKVNLQITNCVVFGRTTCEACLFVRILFCRLIFFRRQL